jgi:hypothetical protein
LGLSCASNTSNRLKMKQLGVTVRFMTFMGWGRRGVLALVAAIAVSAGLAGCVPPAPVANLPAPTLTPGSGPAGSVIFVPQPAPCPIVPAGYSQSEHLHIWDSQGNEITGGEGAGPTDRFGNWNALGSDPAWKWDSTWTYVALPDGGIKDSPVGNTTIRVSCDLFRGANFDKFVKSTCYKDAHFRVTSASQSLRLSATTIRRGQSLTVNPYLGCPAPATDVGVAIRPSNASDQVAFASPAISSTGSWSNAVLDIPSNAILGTWYVAAWCSGYLGELYQNGTSLDYRTYKVSVVR